MTAVELRLRSSLAQLMLEQPKGPTLPPIEGQRKKKGVPVVWVVAGAGTAVAAAVLLGGHGPPPPPPPPRLRLPPVAASSSRSRIFREDTYAIRYSSSGHDL